MSSENQNIALSLSAFDPSAASGILADIKTFESLKVYGLGVSTAISYKAKDKLLGVNWQPLSEITAQLRPLLETYNITSCKIGSVENPDSLIDILKLIRSFQPNSKIVWDPYFSSVDGLEAIGNFNKESLLEISELLDLITPNPEEHSKLSSYSDLMKLSKQVSFLFQKSKKIETDSVDVLQIEAKEIEIGKSFLGLKFKDTSLLSTLITGFLALGFQVEESCKKANSYMLNEKRCKPSRGLLNH